MYVRRGDFASKQEGQSAKSGKGGRELFLRNELEALLLEHPQVKDCAVAGVADREAGEIPKAFVVLKPGGSANGDALMDFLRDKVAGYKRVRQVEIVDAIPRSPSGKILRRLLAEKSQD